MKIHLPVFQIVLAACFSSGLLGCLGGKSNSIKTPDRVSETIVTSTSDTIEPQNTPTPTKLFLMTKTKEPFITPRSIQAMKPFPTDNIDNVLPTWTPFPILDSQEIDQQIIELYKSNNGCKFPCWWGIVPGETLWMEAEQFLSPLAHKMYKDKQDINSTYAVTVQFPRIKSLSEVPLEQTYHIKANMVSIIDVPLGNIPTYSLSRILSDFGPPTDVWIHTFPLGEVPKDAIAIFILLHYKNLGVAISYNIRGYQSDNVIQACPKNNPANHIILWKPGKDVLILEDLIFSRLPFKLKPLIDVTDMNTDEFYSKYRYLDQEYCINTTANFWP